MAYWVALDGHQIICIEPHHPLPIATEDRSIVMYMLYTYTYTLYNKLFFNFQFQFKLSAFNFGDLNSSTHAHAPTKWIVIAKHILYIQN